MLSIKNITGKQASKYYEKDDYYTRSGGEWQGKLREQLALSPNVNKEDFDQLVKRSNKRAGFDLCFSAPKSVSMAMALGPETRLEMITAHQKAVANTLLYIEGNAIYTRVTQNHITRREQTGMMLCGKFNHLVSRNQDPQLHTHCVILNQTLCQDGKFRAIDNENLYQNKMLYGQIYRNELARNLKELGYQIQVINENKGFFELTGISRDQIETFSSRRLEIVAQLQKWNANTAKMAEKAALLTREAKKYQDMDRLMDSWRESLHEQQIQIEKVETGKMIRDPELTTCFQAAEKQLSQMTFAFEKREYLQSALKKSLSHGATLKEAEGYFKSRLNREIIYLGDKNGRQYYCTKESYQIEKKIFEYVALGQGKELPISQRMIQDGTKEKTLSQEQQKAVEHVCSNRDSFSAVQGLAGTGKTYMLGVAREIYEKENYIVKGVCFTGRAAEELFQGAGIESITIHSHLNKLEKEAGYQDNLEVLKDKNTWNLNGLQPGNQKELWIIDEASMVDNRTMVQLMEAAERKQAKVIIVGDARQLQPVGAGNSFSNMIENHKINFIEMQDIRRQKDRNLKEAVMESVRGDVGKSLEKLQSHIIEIRDREKRLQHIAKDFSQQYIHERENSVIITGSNMDRRILNQEVRQALKEEGLLKQGHQMEVVDRQGHYEKKEIAPGEKIMFLNNDKRLGVSNGQTGYVHSIQGENLIISSNQKEYRFNMKEYSHIDYGYAMTTHKGQGITVDKAFIHLDTHQQALNSRNSYYVDVSRARNEVWIYTDDKQGLQKSVAQFQERISGFDFKELEKKKVLFDWDKFKEKFQKVRENLDWKEFKERYLEHNKVGMDKGMGM
jgi:conjugative relaxase-like TrwC/TraI family protein